MSEPIDQNEDEAMERASEEFAARKRIERMMGDGDGDGGDDDDAG